MNDITADQIAERRLFSNNQAINLIDWVAAFLLVICPILQHYKGLFAEAGTETLIIVFPYVLLKLVCKRHLNLKPIIPLALYALYISFIHGFSLFTFAREALLLFYFAAVLNECVNIDQYFRCAKFICLLCTGFIIFQYLTYYLFGKHVQLVPISRFLDSTEQWIGLARTGRISVTGTRMSIYRPSGFFLEPSHLSIYFIPVLTLNLLTPGVDRKRLRESFFMSIAMVLSTSGIGIAIVAGVWLVYTVFYVGNNQKAGERQKIHINTKSLGLLVAFIILFAALYGGVGIFRSSVNRIFFSSESGSGSAIQGRTTTGIRLLRMLSGSQLLFGRGNSVRIADWNVSGFFYTVFQYGWIGCILQYWFYLRGIRKQKRQYIWLILIVIALSFFTVHTFAAFYRMYFICFILGGYLKPYTER